MKIAISSDGDTLESNADQRFGRCTYFLVVDIDDNQIKGFEAVKNQGNIQGHGAGIKAAEQIGNLEVEKVITGNLGPNATDVLNQLEIEAFNGSGKIKDVVNSFIDGKLQKIIEVAEPHNNLQKPDISENKNKDEIIFFPLLDDNGMNSKISPHFGHAPFFGVYDVSKNKLNILDNDLEHTNPLKSPIDQIVEKANPTTIFAKGIGGRAINLIAEKGLSLKTGDYDTVGEVLDNLDKLDDLFESCGHEHHDC